MTQSDRDTGEFDSALTLILLGTMLGSPVRCCPGLRECPVGGFLWTTAPGGHSGAGMPFRALSDTVRVGSGHYAVPLQFSQPQSAPPRPTMWGTLCVTYLHVTLTPHVKPDFTAGETETARESVI